MDVGSLTKFINYKFDSSVSREQDGHQIKFSVEHMPYIFQKHTCRLNRMQVQFKKSMFNSNYVNYRNLCQWWILVDDCEIALQNHYFVTS